LVRTSGSATRASRDHRIWNEDDGILHIAGGKYTTYRLMSEEASDLVCKEIAPEVAGVHRTGETPFHAAHCEIGDLMEQRLDDYMFVSTYLGYEQRWDRASLLPFAQALASRRGWDQARVEAEIQAVADRQFA
jgi:glycerol-3-phosphate dehydrogenase